MHRYTTMKTSDGGLCEDTVNGCAQLHCDIDRTLTQVHGLSSSHNSIKADVINRHSLFSVRAAFVLVLWYLFSFGAIFLNKYIVDNLEGELIVFSAMHFLCAAAMGLLNVYWICNPLAPSVCIVHREAGKDLFNRSSGFLKAMGLLGFMRFLVVFLGLLSLKHVAVSFMETVKSSAPLFTVLISYCILNEKNGPFVQLSLIPIMLGLVLCTAYEISFVLIGFLAAIGTNIAECLQFVLSKLSLSGIGDQHQTSPAELQFYTCSAAFLCHIPIALYFADEQALSKLTMGTFLLMAVNGLLYHFQTMMAWNLMQFLSPLTHSVCNTVKCALAMWLSIPIFHNPVTLPGTLGSIVVVGGVLLYNKARDYERRMCLSGKAGPLSSQQTVIMDDLTEI